MGANVVLCARKKERCANAAEELKALGVAALALACVVTNPASIQEAVQTTIAQFGRIDILINNAGTSWGSRTEKMRLDQWNKALETNLIATIIYLHTIAKLMIVP